MNAAKNTAATGAAKNTAAVRVPGEADQSATGDSAAAGDAGGADENLSDADPVIATAKPTSKPGAKGLSMEERFTKMEAEMNHLRQTNAQLVGMVNTATENVPAVELPSSKDFPIQEQHAMEGPVLTKEGWVVPQHLGSSPVLNQLVKMGLSATA